MPTRAEHRDTTESAIIAAGQRLLAEGGADALTIRGVARELDLVPSALYRYVTKREDLLDLLVQAYLLRLFFVDPSSRLHNIH